MPCAPTSSSTAPGLPAPDPSSFLILYDAADVSNVQNEPWTFRADDGSGRQVGEDVAGHLAAGGVDGDLRRPAERGRKEPAVGDIEPAHLVVPPPGIHHRPPRIAAQGQ